MCGANCLAGMSGAASHVYLASGHNERGACSCVSSVVDLVCWGRCACSLSFSPHRSPHPKRTSSSAHLPVLASWGMPKRVARALCALQMWQAGIYAEAHAVAGICVWRPPRGDLVGRSCSSLCDQESVSFLVPGSLGHSHMTNLRTMALGRLHMQRGLLASTAAFVDLCMRGSCAEGDLLGAFA